MRVLFVHPAFYFKESGVAVMIRTILKALTKRGLSIDVMTTDASYNEFITASLARNDPQLRRLNLYRFKVFRGLVSRKIYIPRDSFLWKAGRIIKSYDVVHIHEYRSMQSVVVANYCKRYRIPFVLQPHGTSTTLSHRRIEGLLKRFFDVVLGRKILADAARLVALNDSERRQFELMGLGEKVSVIPNGIDFREYDHLPPKGLFKTKHGIRENEKMILYLGRIYWVKGLDILVKALSTVVKKERDLNVKLVIAGSDDGYAGTLKYLANDLNLSRKILFTGPLYENEKLSALVDADIFVLPSRSEAFPMTLLEAFACEKPIIVTNAGGLGSLVVNNITGLLTEVGNTEQLSLAIIFMLRNETKANEMGREGKKLAKEKFNIERIAEMYKDIYEEALDEYVYRKAKTIVHNPCLA